MDFVDIGGRLALFFIPLLFALCFHEFAHALVAKWMGDNTAERLGRLSLNPMVHADLIGTFILPISVIVFGIPFFFGWAKPVPVDTRNLRNVRSDMFWISAAGPLSNVFLALVTTMILFLSYRFGIFQSFTKPIHGLLEMFMLVNLFLAFFNLIPLHPLDGGKVLARFLPESINQKLEQNQQITSLVLLVLFISGALAVLRIPVYYVFNILMGIATTGGGGIL